MRALATPELERLARGVRRDVLERSYASKSGHIGSSFSCVEILVALYFSALRIDPKNVEDPARDRFIMSKGHACVPFYSCLCRRGLLPEATFLSYGEEGGPLGHHPKRAPQHGIELSTGSLGHGLSVGAGLAYGARLDDAAFRTFVLLSDGELGEGTVWEAAMFAGQHGLSNLVAVVDLNHMQALGHTRDILGHEPIVERFRAFGWGAERVDGHDVAALARALATAPFEPGKPSVIVADTVKGKGVSFMEDNLLWHYRCPDAGEYERALAEVGDA